MRMPKPDHEAMDRKGELVAGLLAFLPARSVISDDIRLKAFESDALTAYRALPLAVALPHTREQVSEILRLCDRLSIKVVPRGAGTGLSGGALPLADSLVLGLSRLNKILDIDYDNRTVTVETGVTNQAISNAVEARGFYYAPDPSSQIACTIGGNVAENSGGVHCLKYGLTTNNVLGLEVALMNGETLRLGGKHLDCEGYDLLGLMTGSEGLLGIVTEVTVRILKKPQVVRAALVAFDSIEEAGHCVGAIIAAGIVPAGLEMMDQGVICAAEDFCAPGYPRDAAALIIAELDGAAEDVEAGLKKIESIARRSGARSIRLSESEAERLAFWSGRKNAFPAVGRLSPDYLCMDGTIPRGAIAKVLARMGALSARHGLRVVNVFHAGDGNLHPLILYDANIPGDTERAEALGADILRLCVEFGGVLTGEHGVGVEKRDLMSAMFSEDDLNQQQRVKCAFDPHQLLNPGKVFPTLHACVELGKVHVHRGALPFAHLPRF